MGKYQKLFQRFENLNNVWLKDLEKYSDDQLKVRPNEASWTLGQVYNHLLITNQNYFKKQIESCINKNFYTLEAKNWEAKLILLLNMLPPRKYIRYKMLENLENTPSQFESKEEFKKQFSSILFDIKLITEKLCDAHPYQKSKHPSLGMLNAVEWFQMMNIHMEHHLSQKKAIDEMLKIS